MTETSRAFAGEHGAMNNWDKIWKKRTAEIENRATVFEMFKELKRADGFDTQDVQGYYEAFFRQWECMAQRIETGCAGTIGSLYEIGCGSGVNLYLFSALKHVAVLGGLDYSKNLIRIAQSVVPDQEKKTNTWHTAGSVSRIMMKYMRGWTKHFTPGRCSCNLQRSTRADVRSYNLITNCTGITGLCLIVICIKNNA